MKEGYRNRRPQVNSLLTAGRRNGHHVAEVDPERFAKSSWSKIHNTILEHFKRMWHWTFSVQLVSCHYALLQLAY
eukprot:1143271-Pelagomonas_calceolata.AAC.1